MAITSFPFDNQDTDESQFSLLFKELQDSGVADTHNGNGFRVGIGSGMTVQVQPGLALVRGFAVSSNAVEARALTANAGGTVIHRVVLRLDPTANSITLTTLSGSLGGVAPVLTQTTAGVYEIGLATVTVPSGTANITDTMIVDDRDFLGTRVGAWTTIKRPTAPRTGRTGFNVTLGYLEVWTGLAWVPVAPPTGRVGDLKIDSGTDGTTEAGWLECNGAEYPIATYPALALRYGVVASPTVTTFRVPNYKGKVIVGRDPDDADFATVGQLGGAKSVAITEAQMPYHTHGVSDPGHSHNSGFTAANITGGSGAQYQRAAPGGNQTGPSGTGIWINPTGGNQPHPNVQPYAVARVLVKAV